MVVAVLVSIPARLLANAWRLVYEVTIPRKLRKSVYKMWAWRYSADLGEAEKPLEVGRRTCNGTEGAAAAHAEMVLVPLYVVPRACIAQRSC